MKINPKSFGLTIVLSLALMTIINNLLSSFFKIPVLKTGPAFVILFISIFIIMIFTIAEDGKFEKNEFIMLGVIAVSLIVLTYILKNFLPEIFSILPQSTKNIFSSIGV